MKHGKISAWHEHQAFGRVKIVGVILDGVVTVRQVYKNGVSMLFFERGDRNMPCGFSREDIRQFEAILLKKNQITYTHGNPTNFSLAEVLEMEGELLSSGEAVK